MFPKEVIYEITFRIMQGYTLSNEYLKTLPIFYNEWHKKWFFPLIRILCINYCFQVKCDKSFFKYKEKKVSKNHYNALEIWYQDKILTIAHDFNLLPKKNKFRQEYTLQYNLFPQSPIDFAKQKYFQIIHKGKHKLESLSIVCTDPLFNELYLENFDLNNIKETKVEENDIENVGINIKKIEENIDKEENKIEEVVVPLKQIEENKDDIV